jgi:hypothetical protein
MSLNEKLDELAIKQRARKEALTRAADAFNHLDEKRNHLFEVELDRAFKLALIAKL